jgi:oligopeptidase B
MLHLKTFAAMAITLSLTMQAKAQIPPVAKKVPYQHTAHGDIRTDDYQWLNGYFYKTADTTDVVNYLTEENNYTKAVLAPTEALQKSLFAEIKGRIKQDDQSPPYYQNGYWYYSRTGQGQEYAVSCRKKGTLTAPEEILIDGNKMAEGKNYFSLGDISISPNNQLMAYSTDYVSRRQYTIQIKNLITGKTYSEKIENTGGSITWAEDNSTIFYVANDPVTLLSEKIYRHTIGTTQSKDVLVYHEKDKSNYIGINKGFANKYIYIYSGNTLNNEILFIDAKKPTNTFKTFAARMPNVLYNVDEHDNQFYITTNKDAVNFKLMACPLNKTSVANWKEIIPHRTDTYLEGIIAFKNYLIIQERKNALKQFKVINLVTKKENYIDFGEKAYSANFNTNAEYTNTYLRYSYTSLTTPASIIDYDLKTATKKIIKETQVIGSFNKADYITNRVYATAADGTQIPISLVHHKNTPINGTAPLWVYAYGSYGNSTDATFSIARLSLLNRGFVYAIAHVRGGADMGRQWYEDGKMFKKINTFTDFNTCTEFLVNNNYGNAQSVYASGGSAGGLLMGAIANLKPNLYKGIIAAVPFVDVVTTMSDANIPLTTNEYDEWGNPANKESYFYMKSYSPYDNISNQTYPNLLVTTGLHDSQVQYFEPAKWVAKLRTMPANKNLVLLKTNMEAGHGGASGRFKALEDVALQYAFVFMLQGITK